MSERLGFVFSDLASFQSNVAAFVAELTKLDPVAGPLLGEALPQLADGDADKQSLLNDLLATLEKSKAGTDKLKETPGGGSMPSPDNPPTDPTSPTSAESPKRWFLEKVEIEGMRGINNEGSPLSLKFMSDCVNSVSAPNGIGKSSIYDALNFALTGGIPNLTDFFLASVGMNTI